MGGSRKMRLKINLNLNLGEKVSSFELEFLCLVIKTMLSDLRYENKQRLNYFDEGSKF